MNFVDLILFFLVILFTIIGWKKGVIRSVVRLVGLIMIAIIAYQLKTPLASFLIGFMPFFNFAGVFQDVTAINILFYHAVSFVFVFIMLYSILNIVISLAGLLDKLLKATIILYLPDKILGAVVGFVEGVVFAFVVIFTMAQMPNLQEYVAESSYASRVLNRTPIIRTVLAPTTNITEEIIEITEEFKDASTDTEKEKYHIEVLNVMIKYSLVTKEEAQRLIDEEKIYLPGVSFN